MEESEKAAEKGENKEQGALVTEGNNNNSRCSLWPSSLPEALAVGGWGVKGMLPEDSNLDILINLKQIMSILLVMSVIYFFFFFLTLRYHPTISYINLYCLAGCIDKDKCSNFKVFQIKINILVKMGGIMVR